MSKVQATLGALIVVLVGLVISGCQVDDGVVGYVNFINYSYDYMAIEYEGYQVVSYCDDSADGWITGYDYDYNRDVALIPPGYDACLAVEESRDCSTEYCRIHLYAVPFAEDVYCDSGDSRVPCVYEVYPRQETTVIFTDRTDDVAQVDIY